MSTTTDGDALQLIPHKARTPVERLMAKGLIDRATVDVALDAVVYAGQPDRLLPFITAVLYLRAQGISVGDVVKMARSHGRKIKLDWTARRWKEEHDRLSRLETLKTLAAANVVYDLSRFSAALPATFRGYLIPTSRRLGAEGLHQRHCVASYHEGIVRGDYAIAAVFVERTRFTVQLCWRGDCLCVLQARGRFNVPPTPAQMRRIREMLHLSDEAGTEAERSAGARPCYLELFRGMLPILRQHGVETVSVSFDGSGDSGTIDNASFSPAINAASIYGEFASTEYQFVDGRYQPVCTVEQTTLQDAIDKLAMAYIDSHDVDWYNNDGGWGELVLDVESGQVHFEVHVRHTESTCEVDQTIDVMTGAEVE